MRPTWKHPSWVRNCQPQADIIKNKNDGKKYNTKHSAVVALTRLLRKFKSALKIAQIFRSFFSVTCSVFERSAMPAIGKKKQTQLFQIEIQLDLRCGQTTDLVNANIDCPQPQRETQFALLQWKTNQEMKKSKGLVVNHFFP